MNKIAATKLREELAETLNRVAYQGERIVIDRNGKDVAAVVSMQDLERLNEFEAQERQRHLEQARERIHGRYSKTFDRLAKE